MIKIGLTGGIGSGKSTVSQLFISNGIPVFNSDQCSREAEKEPSIQLGFKQILGEDIYVDGELDRAKIRSVLFTDKDKLRQITNLVTPFIKRSFEAFCEKHNDKGFVMLESAILYENGHAKNFDYVITVTASENTRIKRVMTRDSMTVEEVLRKIENQSPDIEKIEKSDFVIINENTDIGEGLMILEKQVKTIIKAVSGDVIIDTLRKINDIVKDKH